MDADELRRRVIERWNEDDTVTGVTGIAKQALARSAVEVLQCGRRHPERPDIRCTDLPHDDNGPVYCRNRGLRVEWWETPSGVIATMHDDLGQISFTAPGRYIHLPIRDAEEAPPAAGEATLLDEVVDATIHPAYWTDSIPQDVTEVWTTDGRRWARLVGYRWFSGSDTMTEQALLVAYGSVYSDPVEPDGEPLGPARSGKTSAGDAVLRSARHEIAEIHSRYQRVIADTIAVITGSAAAVRRVADKYKTPNKTLNAVNYRSLADAVTTLQAAAGTLATLASSVTGEEDGE